MVTSARARNFERSPARYMGCHQRFEQAPVIGDAKVQQLVRYNEVLKTLRFI